MHLSQPSIFTQSFCTTTKLVLGEGKEYAADISNRSHYRNLAPKERKKGKVRLTSQCLEAV
jgi:hypothetical protein